MVMQTKTKKDENFYINLPWTFTVEQEHNDKCGKTYVVRVNEWPGVTTDAPTITEAMEGIHEALALAISMSLEAGDILPEPEHEQLFKGNIAYRTTSERHYLIAREAKKRNQSLSQLIDASIDVNLRDLKKS